GNPSDLARLFGKADGLLGLPHRPRPIAYFDLGPPLCKEHARQVAQAALRTQRSARFGEKARSEVEGADDVGRTPEDPRNARIAHACFEKLLQLEIRVASPSKRLDVGGYRDHARVRLRQLQLLRSQ